MIPRDKLLHAGVGVVVALIALAFWLLAAHLGFAPLSGAPAAIALSTVVAGVVKEAADYLDNREHPGMHGVEVLDAVATAAPGFLIGAAVQQVLLSTP